MTWEEGMQKMKNFCAYQPRCCSEAREKLRSLELGESARQEILEQLIKENHLSEERYASSFSRGRFRIKKWGRIKIKYALMQKQVNPKAIEQALGEIEDTVYLKTLKKLAVEKFQMLKSEKNGFLRKKKTTEYLMQKGYEPRLINKLLVSLK